MALFKWRGSRQTQSEPLGFSTIRSELTQLVGCETGTIMPIPVICQVQLLIFHREQMVPCKEDLSLEGHKDRSSEMRWVVCNFPMLPKQSWNGSTRAGMTLESILKMRLMSCNFSHVSAPNTACESVSATTNMTGLTFPLNIIAPIHLPMTGISECPRKIHLNRHQMVLIQTVDFQYRHYILLCVRNNI